MKPPPGLGVAGVFFCQFEQNTRLGPDFSMSPSSAVGDPMLMSTMQLETWNHTIGTTNELPNIPHRQ
jgi:hypothetical protein